MQIQSYVKSFSHGHITIPKNFRDRLGIGKDFWLKLTLDGTRIVAEPTQSIKDRAAYAKKLLKLKTDWFNFDEWRKMRKEANESIGRHLGNY